MKRLKRIICISILAIILVNSILPRFSFAVISYEQPTAMGLIEAIQDGAKEKIKEKIKEDEEKGNTDYTLTKQFLQEMSSYIQEFSTRADTLVENMEWENSTEGIVELQTWIQQGMGNYFDQSYADFLLKKILEVSDRASEGENLSLYTNNFIISTTATKYIVSQYIEEGQISENAIQTLANEIQTEESANTGLSDEKQAEKRIEEIKEQIAHKIQSLTTADEEKLVQFIEDIMKEIDQENLSDKAKELVKEKMEELFYSYGRVDVEKTQNNLGFWLSTPPTTTQDTVTAQTNIYDPLQDNFGGWILDGLLGIVLYPFKILLLVPGVLINLVLSSIAGIGGQWDTITLEKIFFNEVKLTDINVFKIEGTNTIQFIRTSIAEFYIAFRNLAIALSLAVLVYIGIRMAINSTAEDKAKYKTMLWNWLVGFGLIFILHYIIIFTINANEMMISALNSGTVAQSDYMDQLLGQAWWIPFTTSFASIVMYCTLLIMTFIFLIIYIKRMLTISFLMVVAPLISVTYAIDKVGNNRSEILNTWLKEFMYNVLIQPFHCLIYSALVGIAMDLIVEKGPLDFGAMTFAIILTCCIFLGQKMIREIFGFDNSSSLMQKVAVLALARKTVGNVKNIVALKNSKNELRAKRNMRGIPTQMADGSEANPENMLRMRRMAARNEEENSSSGSNSNVSQVSSQSHNVSRSGATKNSVRKRRRLKNAPPIVKKAVRWYGNALATTSGYNIIKGIKQKRRANQAYKMTREDYWIAASESYRQAQDSKMSNEQLAQKMRQLYDIDIQDIHTPEDLNYKLFIESMKSDFSKERMEDLIINGTSDNKRWRK